MKGPLCAPTPYLLCSLPARSGTDLSAVRSVYALAAALPELPSLVGLDLFDTGIVEAGFAVLGPVIAGLASLERLDFGCNPEMLGEGDCSDDLCDVLEVRVKRKDDRRKERYMGDVHHNSSIHLFQRISRSCAASASRA